MRKTDFKYPDRKAHDFVVNTLAQHQISIADIAQIAYEMDRPFIPTLTMDECTASVDKILWRRDILDNAMIMLELDRLAENHQLAEPLNSIICADAGIFSADEELAIEIANSVGSIGVANFGYFDRVKTGKAKQLDEDSQHVNTFLDDLITALAAAACARLSHHNS